MNGSLKTVLDTGYFAFVDVRDVGEAHARAFMTPAAVGSDNSAQLVRIHSRSLKYHSQRFSSEKGRGTGRNLGAPMQDVYKVDNRKIKKDLGMIFRSLQDCIHD